MTGEPVGERPKLFVAVAITHGVLAVAFAVFISFFTWFFVGSDTSHKVNVLELVFLGFFGAFLTLVVVVFTAQAINAITLLTRSGGDRGTVRFGRFMQVLPYPTTRWSAFWVAVQVKPWQHPRLLGVFLLLFTGGLSFALWRDPVAIGIAALVCLVAAVGLVIWQLR